jgi:hypothetical protein
MAALCLHVQGEGGFTAGENQETWKDSGDSYSTTTTSAIYGIVALKVPRPKRFSSPSASLFFLKPRLLHLETFTPAMQRLPRRLSADSAQTNTLVPNYPTAFLFYAGPPFRLHLCNLMPSFPLVQSVLMSCQLRRPCIPLSSLLF